MVVNYTHLLAALEVFESGYGLAISKHLAQSFYWAKALLQQEQLLGPAVGESGFCKNHLNMDV